MAVDGVNKVSSGGRYTLPPELADRFAGEYLAASEREDGEKIVLTRVSDNE